MPQGTEPPPVTLPQSVFDALSGLSYSSANKAFLDANNNNIYLFVEKDSNNAAQWFWATNSDGGVNPRGEIPELTAALMSEGTYNSQTKAVSYNGSNYKIRLERDANGVPIAKAYTV